MPPLKTPNRNRSVSIRNGWDYSVGWDYVVGWDYTVGGALMTGRVFVKSAGRTLSSLRGDLLRFEEVNWLLDSTKGSQSKMGLHKVPNHNLAAPSSYQLAHPEVFMF